MFVEGEAIKRAIRHETLIVMSDFLSIIMQRRSIRKYRKEPVPLEVIYHILETAVCAPSAHNAQPWRFVVLTDQNQKKSLADAMAQEWIADMKREHGPMNINQKSVEASAKRFAAAPILVLCCIDMENMDIYPDEKRQGYEHDLAVQSLAAAIQNLLLSAHSEGLGGCWFCAPIFCKIAVRQVLKIPDTVEPQALITLGYPAEKPAPPKRYPSNAVFFLDWYGHPLEK